MICEITVIYPEFNLLLDETVSLDIARDKFLVKINQEKLEEWCLLVGIVFDDEFLNLCGKIHKMSLKRFSEMVDIDHWSSLKISKYLESEKDISINLIEVEFHQVICL